MNKGYIALLDSGVGGISVLNQLVKILPNERYLYYGDNYNAPYGTKSIFTLKEITFKNIDYIKHYNIKLLIVACNTLSVNLLKDIAQYSGLTTFGVFPPIEKALIEGKKNLLIATERTAENYKGIKGLTAVGLKTLAKDIEENAFNLENLDLSNSLRNTTDLFSNEKGYYDNIILGCTHYYFVKNKIVDHFRPQKIIFGENFTAKAVKNYLKNTKSLVNNKENKLLFIGENAKNNRLFFENLNKFLIKN